MRAGLVVVENSFFKAGSSFIYCFVDAFSLIYGFIIFSLVVPMIQNLETTLRSGAVPQAPQFKPAANVSRSSGAKPKPLTKEKNTQGANDKSKSGGQSKALENVELPTAKSGAQQPSASNGVADSLGDVRSKVQEEITAEFAAIMATGTLRASEAAALATKRVMQRHGNLSSAMPRS